MNGFITNYIADCGLLNMSNEEIALAYKETKQDKYIAMLYNNMYKLGCYLLKCDNSYYSSLTEDDRNYLIMDSVIKGVAEYNVSTSKFSTFFRVKLIQGKLTLKCKDYKKRKYVTEIKSISDKTKDTNSAYMLSDIEDKLFLQSIDFTKKEKIYLKYFSLGYTNKEIAGILKVSVTHMYTIRDSIRKKIKMQK